MLKLIFILSSISLVHSYPKGAPDNLCTSMMPKHGVVPQQCQSKYNIQSEKSEYNVNEIIRITVSGLTSNDSFKGILLVAKSQNNQQVIGTWSIRDAPLKTISCDGTQNTAVTHSSADNKQQIVAFWHAPAITSEENIIIKATIVKSYDEIYVDCFNLTLKTQQNNSTRGQSIGINTNRDISTKKNTNVTWNYNDGTVTVTMTTGNVSAGEWRSIGFSLDQQMGDEYIFLCEVSSTGDASLRRMHTKQGKRPPSVSNEEVNLISATYENGYATCEFSFETTSGQIGGEPAPLVTEKSYYVIFAAGILRAPLQIAKHTLTFVTPITYQLQNSENINLDEPTTTTTVSGTTTSSFSVSSTATTVVPQTKNVGVNVTWTYLGGVTAVKMIITNLRSSQWVALGLSLDDLMGEDHVFICQHSANNTVLLQRFINVDGQSRPVLASTMVNPGGTFNVSQQKLENGIIHCDFSLSNFGDMKRHARQISIPTLSQTTSYQPLIATGNLDSSDVLTKHSDTSRAALKQRVSLNQQETIVYNIDSTGSNSMSLMKAHGIIMIFTWIALVSTGILVARYFKRSWPVRKICGKAVWFAIHRAIMTCVAILTLIAFILILVYKKGQWISQKREREFAHSIVGILVISFALIQPVIALFRCNPDSHYRFIFNYVHAIIGISALILSIAAIFLAMVFTQFQFQANKEWAILIAWSCWLLFIIVVFEIIEMYFRKYASSMRKTNLFDMNNDHSNGGVKIETFEPTENAKKDRIKGLLLIIHIVIALGLSIVLATLIGKS